MSDESENLMRQAEYIVDHQFREDTLGRAKACELASKILTLYSEFDSKAIV
jgi:hypothetical protein